MTLHVLICPRLPKILKSIVRKSLSGIQDINEVMGISEANVVVCEPSEFVVYQSLTEQMDDMSIVNPLWAFYSSARLYIEDPVLFSAHPQLIFSGLTINIRHLDHCCMTDFYSNMIAYFGGRVIDDSTEYSTHTIMETKPFQSASLLHHEEIDIADLVSLPLNLTSINVFVDAFFMISGQGCDSALVTEEESSLKIKRYQSNHCVSYSWLDACIAQLKKLPEEPYYTVYKGISSHPPRYDTIGKKVVQNDNDFDSRTNESQPLTGTSFLVSNRIGGVKKKHLENAAIWLGSLALTNINDLKILENSNQQRLIMIVPEPYERVSDDISCTYITPYYISKLLRCEDILEGPLGVPYSTSMSYDLSMFLNLIYHPIHQSKCTPVQSDHNNKVTSLRGTSLWGKIFAISGFNEVSPCDEVPCKYDIAAGVRILGGHTESCMVEGLTTHLICETMNGEKYKVAKKWGTSKIKIVHWKWLLECLSKWTITETFDDNRNIFAAESDNLIENSVQTLEIMKIKEKENKIERKYACENENENKNENKDEIDQEKNNQIRKYTVIDGIKIMKEKDSVKEHEEWRLKAKLLESVLNKEHFNDSFKDGVANHFDENEIGDGKKSDDSSYFVVSDFNFYNSQISQATNTNTGDLDDVHTSEALESSTPEIPTLNVMPVSEEGNINDEISDETRFLELQGDPLRTQHILKVPVKNTEISTKMTVEKELVEDVGVIVEIDAQNEIVHEAPNRHLTMLSPLVMPHYENTALTPHIMESNDAVKIYDNSLEYRFQFGGGDDDEITYARTIVESLGGSVVADDSCTHLVLWKMTRTEKYLCACASGKWILRPLYLAACFEAAKDIPDHPHRKFLSEVEYEWGAEESLTLLEESQKQWALAGKKWRLARDVLQPFNGENVLIIGITAPPAGTLSRMVVCGGGKVSIVENMTFLCEDDVCSKDIGKNLPVTTGKNSANYPGGDNMLNDRTLIITAPNNKYNEDLLLKLDSLLKERGISALLKSPSFLLDVLCGACMTPAHAAASTLINTTTTNTTMTSSVAEPIQHITPFYKIENVLLYAPSVAPSACQTPVQSKRRKYLHSDIPIV